MIRIYRLLGTIIVLALLTGCGPNVAIGGAGLPITVTNRPLTTTNDPANTARTGPVTLRTNAKVYGIKATIFITLSNQSKQTIYFPDHLTNCTVILLQRQPIQLKVSRSLQTVNPCRLGILTRLHALGAGQSLIVRLIAPLQGWPPGAYRAVLSYCTSISAGVTTTISAGFQVGPFVREGL